MKTITRSRIYLPMAAMTLMAALAIPAAQNQVPFKGTIQGQDIDKGFTSPGMFLVETDGTGTGILFGRFTFTLETTINVENLTDTGIAHFKAANGDTIDATYTSVMPAELTPTPDGVVFSIKEVYTITGGTGRFAGAQGSFLIERVADPQRFLTFGSFHGTITPPGAVK
ncbi:MAG: hypothetical protein ABI822_00310 [Bryobacteraceae bacterium]